MKENLKAFPLEIQEDVDKRKPQQKSCKKKRIQSINLEGPRATVLWLGFLLCLETIMLLLLKKWPSSAHYYWREQHISLPLAWVQTSLCSACRAREQLQGAEEPERKADEPAVTMWNACSKKPNSTEQRNHVQIFTFAILVLCVVLDTPTVLWNSKTDWSGLIQYIPKKVSVHQSLIWQCCPGKITLGTEFKALFFSLK